MTRVTALDGAEPEGTELEGTKLEGRLKNLDVRDCNKLTDEAIKKVATYVSQLRRIGKGHAVWHFNQSLN